MKRAYTDARSQRRDRMSSPNIAAKPLTGPRHICVRPACGFFVSISVYWGTLHGYRLLES